MTTKKWSEIRAKKFSPDDLCQIDQEVESELVELNLRALRRYIAAIGGALETCAIVNGKRIKLVEG